MQALAMLQKGWKCIDDGNREWQNFARFTGNTRGVTAAPTQLHLPNPHTVMNKAELVQAVQKALGKDIPKAQAERALDAVIDSIKAGLKKDQSVQLVGFGTFRVASRKARMGVNPKTGEKLKIKASKSVKFSAGKDLKSRLGK
jgi:DNA-binding protein HU-beta